MCFSYESSIISLLVGTISSIFVFLLGGYFDKIVGSWFLYVSLMQGIDAILWKHQTCDNFHKNVTLIGSLLNSSQPFFLVSLFYIFSKDFNMLPSFITILLYGLYGIFINDFFKNHPDNYYCTSPRPGDPHLVWNWTVGEKRILNWLVYLLTLILLAKFGLNEKRGNLFGGSILLGLVLSYFMYPRESIGSLWCFFTALTPPIYLILRKLGYTF